MVHAGHTGHAPHAHVGHRRERSGTERRHRGDHARAWCQRGAGHARPVDALAYQGIGAVLGRRDDDVIGFGHADLEFLDTDRAHCQPVRRDDGHPQAGYPHVEGRHRRSVDHAQPHPLARTEQAGPIVRRPTPVDQIAIGCARPVGDVRRVHPHPPPVESFPRALVLTGQQAAQRLPLEVVIARLQLHPAEDGGSTVLAVVGQHDDMVAVGRDRIGRCRIDDDRSVQPLLLLPTGMAVIPIGPALPHREPVGERRAGSNTGERDARHAVILKRHEQTVPVQRRIGIERVDDVDRHVLPFAQPDQGAGRAAVDTDRTRRPPVDPHRLARNPQRDRLARHRRQRVRPIARQARRGALRPAGRRQAERQPPSGQCRIAQQSTPVDRPRHRYLTITARPFAGLRAPDHTCRAWLRHVVHAR